MLATSWQAAHNHMQTGGYMTADEACAESLARMSAGTIFKNDSPFCLSQMLAFETGDENLQRKQELLVKGATDFNGSTHVERACTIGTCTLKITEDIQDSRQVSGRCMAASYCLKQVFEAVGQGEASYDEIIDNLDGFASKYSAGNFCPRLDCGLSAGVSIDGNAGTAGECALEQNGGQLELGLIPSAKIWPEVETA
jgi:hypothetical protein